MNEVQRTQFLDIAKMKDLSDSQYGRSTFSPKYKAIVNINRPLIIVTSNYAPNDRDLGAYTDCWGK